LKKKVSLKGLVMVAKFLKNGKVLERKGAWKKV
jgi:hypothetical protein